MCFSRERSTLRLIESDARILLAIPKKIGDKLVNKTWLAHTRGRCTNVSEGLITLRMQHRWSCGEGWEKQPTIYLVERIWWCTILCLAGEECVRLHWEDVPRMVQPLSAGCAKDDSSEIIKRMTLARSSRDSASVCWRCPCAILSWDSTGRWILWRCPFRLFVQRNQSKCVATEQVYVRYASQRNKSMSVVWIYFQGVVCPTTTVVHGGVLSTIVVVRNSSYYCVEKPSRAKPPLLGGLDWLDTYEEDWTD